MGLDIEAFRENQIKLYFHVACACAWICDYISGFTDEKSLIWGTRWRLPKILYFLTRYLPFVSLGVHLHYSFTAHNERDVCARLQNIISGFTATSMFCADLTFTIRTWAVWQPYRKRAVLIPILFVGVWISRIAMLVVWLRTLTLKPDAGTKGCHLAPVSKVILPFNIVFAAYVGVLFGLMTLKAYSTC
ncbi:hypothetical protein BDZ94DRAFT_385763 [Collybia nuda]|uniref:DUF6533 domain-containing protein n=1 Tax=Collybia nuda TaxID=64659 RepID=A0A9P5YAH4_9AGAR|nr:hypothetical protein BDZ94DRAFT_385763 [Collybia nuda]